MENKSLREIGKELQAECGTGFWIGNEMHFPPMLVNGRYFSFKPRQTMFLYLMKKYNGSVEKAATMVGWDKATVDKFFSSRKWRQYRERLLAKAATRNGDLVEEWWNFVVDGMRGYRERYEGVCGLCHEEYSLEPSRVEMYRDDDMKINFECETCKSEVTLQHVQQEFKPSREQVQLSSELGSRVEPKRERVHHTFSEETYVFSPSEPTI